MNINEQTKFAAFLEEGLYYVDAWCATKINEGGCGYFAKILSDKLKEKGIDHQIFALYYNNERGKRDKESLEGEEAIKEFVNNGNFTSKTGADHIVVKVGELYVDSTGICNADFHFAVNRILLSDEQVDKVDTMGKWNPTFDRECLPKIKDLINEMFKKMDTFVSGCFKYPGFKEVKFTPHTIKYIKESNPLSELLSNIAGS